MESSTTDSQLLKLLQNLDEALADMPAMELVDFVQRWQILAHNALGADYTRDELLTDLRQLMGAFPTLRAHKLDQVVAADVITRYSVNPVVPAAPKPVPVPVPVHNEVVRHIWQLYYTLSQRLT